MPWSACKRGLPFPSPVVLLLHLPYSWSFPQFPEGGLLAHPQLSSPAGCCFQRGSGQVPRSPANTASSVLATHQSAFAPLGNALSPSTSEALDPVPVMFMMDCNVHLDEDRVYLFHLLHLYLHLHLKKTPKKQKQTLVCYKYVVRRRIIV